MNTNSHEQIIEAVENCRPEIVAFLQRLVQFDSVTGHEGHIQDFVARTLREINLEVDQFDVDADALKAYAGYLAPDLPTQGRPNVVGTWKGGGHGRSLLLNGHVDTVPLEPLDQWTDGPLSGIVRDGKIWGRGSSDMKSGLAAMTMAVSILRRIGFQPAGDVILEYTVDEERTGLGTLMCVHRDYRADAGISCETSDLQIMPACIGRMWFTIRLRGKAAGISARWEGIDAIQKAMKIIQAVDELEKMRFEDLHHPLLPDNRGALPCAVTMLQAGVHPSTPPAAAILRGSMGLMPYEDPVEVEQQLRDQIERVARADPWLRNNLPEVMTEGGYVAAGAEIPKEHPIVQTVVQAFERTTAKAAVLGARMGAADTRFLIRQGNTPSVIFGPGPTSQMHAMNEYVPEENLIVATKVLALTIRSWCAENR